MNRRLAQGSAATRAGSAQDHRYPQQEKALTTTRRTALLLALTAAVVGSIQVGSALAGAARDHVLTVIATLRLVFCGSLLVVGAMVLVNLWRDHKNRL